VVLPCPYISVSCQVIFTKHGMNIMPLVTNPPFIYFNSCYTEH